MMPRAKTRQDLGAIFAIVEVRRPIEVDKSESILYVHWFGTPGQDYLAWHNAKGNVIQL